MQMERSVAHSPALHVSPSHGRIFSRVSPARQYRSARLTHATALRNKRPAFGRGVFAVAAELDVVYSVAPVVRSATTLLYSLSFLLGAAFISQKLATEQDRFENRERCPRCNGTGVEECMCTRWSDGDVGCGSCGNTGYTECSACGGGGTAVPIPLSIRKQGPSSSSF